MADEWKSDEVKDAHRRTFVCVASEVLGVAAAGLRGSQEVDSLAAAELLFAIEEAAGVRPPTDVSLPEIRTIDDAWSWYVQLAESERTDSQMPGPH